MRAESVRASEFRELWKLALPLALAQAGQASMGMVDTAVLGRLSPAAQAGGGLGNSLTFTFSFFGMGVMFALDPLVSQAFGARDELRARNHYWQGVWLAGLTSLVVMVPLAVVPFFLETFGVKPDVAEGARTYMLWRLPGVFGLLLFVAARSYLTGVGRVRATLWAMVLANIANLALDVGFVFGLKLGVAGASIATVLCTWLQFGILAYALPPAPAGTTRAFNREEQRATLRLGVPVGLHFIAESGVFSLVGVLAAALSASDSAAHNVALNWGSLTFCVTAGIGSAAATRVGWSIGRGDTPGARRAGLTGFGSAALFMAASSVVFLLIPRPLAALMSDDPGVISTVVSLFVVVAFFQVSDGVQAVGAGALRGTGDTRFTFYVNLIGHWLIGLPVAWWLGVRGPYGVVGLWWGLCAGLTFVALALLARFAMTTRRHIAALNA